jgi:hypothetical protein
LSGGVTGGGDEVGRAGGGLDRGQARQEPEHPAGAAQRDLPPAGPAAKGADRDAVLRREPDVAERRGRPLREEELLGRAARHRGRTVEEERDRDVLLLDEQLHEQLLEPREHVPVELAQVVAQGVVAVIRELHALAALDTPPAALQSAPDRRAEEEQQALELAQERLVEDGRVDLVREERGSRASLCGAAGR